MLNVLMTRRCRPKRAVVASAYHPSRESDRQILRQFARILVSSSIVVLEFRRRMLHKGEA